MLPYLVFNPPPGLLSPLLSGSSSGNLTFFEIFLDPTRSEDLSEEISGRPDVDGGGGVRSKLFSRSPLLA